ncbi:hypothetical protein Ancab_002561 [Ancistrocladus abbreviatus]
MALSYSSHKELQGNPVLFEEKNYVRKVILNRPRKLNTLNHEMSAALLKKLKAYEEDPNIKLVILKGNGKAFCAGGDVAAMIQTAISGHWSYPTIFYGRQLRVNYLLATYNKPVVSLIHGIVMGGGAGMAMQTPFRIVTENTVFAMPEAAIGLYPDVGASHFLSRLRGYFGEYLGLTGARLDGREMLACGLATHFVLSKELPELENALENVAGLETSTIRRIVDTYAHKPTIKEDSPCFRYLEHYYPSHIEEILQALVQEKEVNCVADKWLINAINSIKQACPSSLKIFLRSVREGREQRLDQCLIQEHIITGNIFSRRISDDFYEGVRTMFFEKDKKPKWEPSKLELVSKERVDQYFMEIDDEDFQPLRLYFAPRWSKSQPFVMAKARL